MSRPLAALVGGAAGAVALVGIVIIFIWFCLFHNRNISRASETGSSDPSVGVGRNIGIELSSTEGAPLLTDPRGPRCFLLEELVSATKNFDEINLIGEGRFGRVYKGMLHDGMFVAIKRRPGRHSEEFIEEARYLSYIRHQNLVSLLGYCQESDQKMLIYEYIPMGSVSSHLYGPGTHSKVRLEFKYRLSIALLAAKGLSHLHSLHPPLIHKDFKTRNVLVDENYIAKIANSGLRDLLQRINDVGPSSQMMGANIFLDPEVRELGRFSEKSDVYSFGVFLLELATGLETVGPQLSESNQSIVEWVKTLHDSSNFIAIIDQKLGGSFTVEGMNEFIGLILRCVDPSGERRPTMDLIVAELDRILEKEKSLTTITGEGTPIVTLGSQLFTASK